MKGRDREREDDREGEMGCRRRSPDLDHGLSWLHETADVLADLSVRLSRLSEVVPHFLAGLVQGPPLVGTHPPHCTAARGRLKEEQQSVKTETVLAETAVSKTMLRKG